MIEKVLELNNEKNLFLTLVGVLVIALSFYIYLINVTVHNTVARQNLESESANLTLSIGNKEFQYIQKRNGITLDTAHKMGYKDSKVTSYINTSQDRSVAIR